MKEKKNSIIQFNFGRNWKNYSEKALDLVQLNQSRKDFLEYFKNEHFEGKKFLDIGFGQGLSLIHAAEQGADVYGLDINPLNKEVTLKNAQNFLKTSLNKNHLYIASILEKEAVNSLLGMDNLTFDIVHSWGVLHHTGNMWEAIQFSTEYVKPEGRFYLAIYNKHWSSVFWKVVKWFYNVVPPIVQKLMIFLFYGLIYLAKFLVTLKNPLKKERGMNFYYDIIDWVGGYPYEYASEKELTNFMRKLGFDLVYFKKSEVPTGCYEYVFQKTKIV